MMMQRLAGLVVASLLATACASDGATDLGAGGAASTVPGASDGSTTIAGPEPSTGLRAASGTEVAGPPPDEPTAAPAPEEIVFVGDSFARQFFEAGRVLLAGHPAVDVRYLISAGPAFAGDDWPAVVAEFVPRPERAAVLISFGTWQSTPPPESADQLTAADLDAEIGSYLAPLAALATARPPSLLLRPDVDDAEADERLQRANAATRPLALAAGLDVYDVTGGEPAFGDRRAVEIAVDAQTVAHYPLRSPLDPTHYCPAAALAMVRDGLARQGVDLPLVTADQVDALFASTAGLGLFIADGCELLSLQF
ncbi:MAG: hypothetical protein HKN26_04665 [Acidimicrobiales bacterium]|nr:hypothetical protein [Acidimicrobiales bacterium]